MDPSAQTQVGRPDIRLDCWFLWVAANTVGWALGLGSALAAGIAVTEVLGLGEATGEYGGVVGLVGLLAALIVGIVMTAVTVGVGQWLILRRYISRAGWWILASAIGMVAGIGVALSVGKTLPSWAALGGIVAIPQWLVLRRQVSQAGWWTLAGVVGGTVGGATGHVMAEIIRTMRVVSTSGLLAAALYVPAVVGSTITGAVLVWLLSQSAPSTPGTSQERATPDTVQAICAPVGNDYARAEKRRELIPSLPLAVPVEPRGLIVLALSMGIGLTWMLLGVLAFVVIVSLPQFASLTREGQALTPIVLVAILGMMGGFVLSLAALNSPLTWMARSGTLTIDEYGMKLQLGAREEAFTWRQPIRVRRWKASFMDEDADVYEDMYEVWQLEQGSAQTTISRRTRVKRRKLLSQYTANGQGLPTTERGLLIPLKAQLVFDAIASMGNLEFVEDADPD